MPKKRVYSYFDGSNFYHIVKNAYGVTAINFHHISNNMLKLEEEELVRIRYFNSPINQVDDPLGYAKQLKFFEKIKSTPLLDLMLGRLVKRPLAKININCPKCNHQKAETLNCPSCKKPIMLNQTYKISEKGVDVQLAITLLLDALQDKYDVALLFSGDADFCPAIRYIIKELGKEIIFCHLPSQKTNELIQTCSSKRIVTKEIVNRSTISFSGK